MDFVSVIPARGGSKGIPRKNLLELDGHPLIYYSIIPSLESAVGRTIVSTEDDEIASVARELGADVIERPEILAGDLVPTEPVIEHVILELNLPKDTGVVLLQPTSPLRSSSMINGAVNQFISNDGQEAVFSAHYEKYYRWKYEINRWRGIGFDHFSVRVPRQGVSMDVRENGNIFVTSAGEYLDCNRFGKNPRPYIIHPVCGMELDNLWEVTLFDHMLAEHRRGNLKW